MREQEATTIPILRIAATYPIGPVGGAQLSFETYLPQDAPTKELHLMTDKLEAVAQRQLYKGLIAGKQDQIDAAERNLGFAIKDLAKNEKERADAQELHAQNGRRGMALLAEKKSEAIEIIRNNIEVHQSNIAQLKNDIIELRRAIAMAVE